MSDAATAAGPQAVRHWRASANRAVPSSLPVQFLRYVVCAGLAALVNFAAGSILVDGCGFATAATFPLAVALAYVAGMIVNFLLNRRFTFASDRSGIAQGRTFVVVALSGLVLTTAAAALLRDAFAAADILMLPGLLGPFGTPESLGRVAAIALAAAYSFTAHKYLTFNRGIRWSLLRVARALPFGGQFGRT